MESYLYNKILHEPLAREIGQPLPTLTTLNKYYTIVYYFKALTKCDNLELFNCHFTNSVSLKRL